MAQNCRNMRPWQNRVKHINCLSALSTLFLGNCASNPPLAEWGQLWAEGGTQIKATNAGSQQHPPLQCKGMGHPISGHFHPSTWNKQPVDYKDAGTTEMAFLQLPYSFSISNLCRWRSQAVLTAFPKGSTGLCCCVCRTVPPGTSAWRTVYYLAYLQQVFGEFKYIFYKSFQELYLSISFVTNVSSSSVQLFAARNRLDKWSEVWQCDISGKELGDGKMRKWSFTMKIRTKNAFKVEWIHFGRKVLPLKSQTTSKLLINVVIVLMQQGFFFPLLATNRLRWKITSGSWKKPARPETRSSRSPKRVKRSSKVSKQKYSSSKRWDWNPRNWFFILECGEDQRIKKVKSKLMSRTEKWEPGEPSLLPHHPRSLVNSLWLCRNHSGSLDFISVLGSRKALLLLQQTWGLAQVCKVVRESL